MKKVTIDLLLGRRTKCHFRRTTPKTHLIRGIFPVGNAVKTVALGTTLSQRGLFVDEVIKQINIDMKDLVGMRGFRTSLIYASPAKTFVLEYQLPTIYALTRIAGD